MTEISHHQNVVPGTSNRSISVSFSLSVAAHLTLFLALAVFLGVRFEQGMSCRPLVIHLQAQETDGILTADAEPDSTIDNAKPANPAKRVEIEKTTETKTTLVNLDQSIDPTKNEQEQSPVSGLENSTDTIKDEYAANPQLEGEHEDAAISIDDPAAPNDLDVAMVTPSPREQTELTTKGPALVATIRASEQIVAPSQEASDQPAIEKISMPPRQARMLNKKFEKWAGSFHKMELSEQKISWEHKGQPYTARIKRMPAKDDMEIEQIVVEVSTKENGSTVSTEMRMKRLAFSNFGQFVSHWDPDVQVHDDELDGRFHSNSQINLLSTRGVTPKFHGKVTTASRQINMGNSHRRTRRHEIFLGGLETGVRKIVLPRHFVPFPKENSVGEAQIQYFDEDTRIRFLEDGTYGWKPTGSSLPEQKRFIDDDTSYLISAKKTKLFVRGVVNGKVLVYSPEKIVIEDDLIYAHDPEATPDANNYLGLVSDKYIEIAEPEVTGPGDLSIHASMYAKRRFKIKDYRSEGTALLFVYGSLTAGSLSATEPRYRTRIKFDKRLETKRPPGFPVTNRYEVESWDAKWRLD